MLLLPAYLAGFIVFVVLVVYGMAISRLLSVRVRRSRGLRSVALTDLPRDLRMLLQQRGHELEAMGLEFCGALQEDYFVEDVDELCYSLLYRDRAGASVARLTLAESPTRMQPVELAFYSCAADGRVLETVAWRAHRLAPNLPGHLLVDAETHSWDSQWESHRRSASADALFVPLQLDAALVVERLTAARSRALQFELAEGRFVERRDGALRFGLGWAFNTVMRANGGERRRLRTLAKLEKGVAVGRDDSQASGALADLTPDLTAHRRRDAVERSRRSGWLKKLVLFLSSVLLFALAFGIQLTPRTVILLLAALFIHEAGHALAMRFFGYRDLQILFIPFLGAVASGRKENVAAWQEVVVLLAGPVPGIVVATIILTTGWGVENDWIRNGAQFMLFLNYLNLLPIVPLDGGRVMSIVLFDRHPRVQFGFSAMSALAIIGVGVALGEGLIACIGIVLLAGVPRQLEQVRMFTRVRDALLASATKEAALVPDRMRSVYAELHASKFDRWNSETKYQFVRHVLERLDRQTANLRVAMASLTAYCAVLIVPVGFFAYMPIPHQGESAAKIEVEAPILDLEGQIAAVAKLPEPSVAPVSEERVEAIE